MAGLNRTEKVTGLGGMGGKGAGRSGVRARVCVREKESRQETDAWMRRKQCGLREGDWWMLKCYLEEVELDGVG